MTEKSDTTFRLLKPGKELNFGARRFIRFKNVGESKNITKLSYVPYQLILDKFIDQNAKDKKVATEKYLKAHFEDGIITVIPDLKKQNDPVLPEPVIVKKDSK